MSICSDSQARKRATAIALVKKYLGSFHVPLLASASNRRDFVSVMPRYKAPAWSLLPLSVPEVRRLLWQLFWQWLPTEAYILIGLIGGDDIKRLLSSTTTNVA